MTLLKNISQKMMDPRLRDVDVNSDELLEVHGRILREKPLMNKVFNCFYDRCMEWDKRYFTGDGLRIELGAGVSFFKERYPEIITTDVKKAPNLDRVLDAQAMDLPDNSVRAFYGINCFHHFPEPRKFFAELVRTLQPGGGAVLIEPYYGPVATRMYSNLFDTEFFDKNQRQWETHTSVMKGANQALSYIVFVRDKTIFQKEFPQLEIVKTTVLNNYLQYLLSGGLNFKSLIPCFMNPLVDFLAFLITPLNRWLGLHYAIVIRKKS